MWIHSTRFPSSEMALKYLCWKTFVSNLTNFFFNFDFNDAVPAWCVHRSFDCLPTGYFSMPHACKNLTLQHASWSWSWLIRRQIPHLVLNVDGKKKHWKSTHLCPILNKGILKMCGPNSTTFGLSHGVRSKVAWIEFIFPIFYQITHSSSSSPIKRRTQRLP